MICVTFRDFSFSPHPFLYLSLASNSFFFLPVSTFASVSNQPHLLASTVPLALIVSLLTTLQGGK